MIELRLFNNYLLMPPFLFPANDLSGFSPPPLLFFLFHPLLLLQLYLYDDDDDDDDDVDNARTHARHGDGNVTCRWLPPLLSNSAKQSE